MTKFKRVLSDEWLPLEFKSGNEIDVTSVMVNKSTLKSIVEQMEQAVLARLAEQEPVTWRVWLKDLRLWSYSSEYHGCGEPLYAQPCVSPVSDKPPYDSENEKCETQIPEGWQLVPIEPTGEMWDGLARKILLAFDFNCKSPNELINFLKMSGFELPEAVLEESEMKNLDHVISKGTRAVILYKAMLEAAPKHDGGKK